MDLETGVAVLVLPKELLGFPSSYIQTGISFVFYSAVQLQNSYQALCLGLPYIVLKANEILARQKFLRPF